VSLSSVSAVSLLLEPQPKKHTIEAEIKPIANALITARLFTKIEIK
jgi:hypothetical protein